MKEVNYLLKIIKSNYELTYKEYNDLKQTIIGICKKYYNTDEFEKVFSIMKQPLDFKLSKAMMFGCFIHFEQRKKSIYENKKNRIL